MTNSTTQMLAKMKKNESSIKKDEIPAHNASSMSSGQTPTKFEDIMEFCLNQKKEPKLTPNS